MSRVLAIVTAFLTISHSCVNAQPGLPGTCLPGFNWVRWQLKRSWIKFMTWVLKSFNSLGQSPCVIATALADICPTSSGYTYGPLLPGWHWYGPSQSNNNSCLCSTVLYSIMCACAYCQNGGCLEWLRACFLMIKWFLTFSPLLAGQSTMLVVPPSTSKCELQLLCPYQYRL